MGWAAASGCSVTSYSVTLRPASTCRPSLALWLALGFPLVPALVLPLVPAVMPAVVPAVMPALMPGLAAVGRCTTPRPSLPSCTDPAGAVNNAWPGITCDSTLLLSRPAPWRWSR